MTTRRAKDKSVLNQARYASSPEFERGLLGNLVAKRAALVDDAADRELIWFIQYLSHQEGGIKAVAKDIIAKYPERIQSKEMVNLKLRPDSICTSQQTEDICRWAPDEIRIKFGVSNYLSADQLLDACAPEASEHQCSGDGKKENVKWKGESFFKAALEYADSDLERQLSEFCLDPSFDLESSAPWYFPRLIETLREYQTRYIETKSAGIVTTALGEKVCEVLDYTAFSRGLTLMEGEARRGKSFAARQWCERHPGQARFIEVPTGNDEAGFFRELARGLGIGNFLHYKVVEIRARVEAVLLTGNLMIVLDEAHRLWPQINLRYGYPSRINWLMAMANHNVPICCIATPQFIQMQKAAESRGLWNSAQLTGRISHYESLPAELSAEDLQAVAKAVLPEADQQVLRVLATYARTSDRYLAAIDSISKRARFIATRAGRESITSDDVRTAMKESVIPADTKLHLALEADRKFKRGKGHPPVQVPQEVIHPSDRSETFRDDREELSRRSADPFSRIPEASLMEA